MVSGPATGTVRVLASYVSRDLGGGEVEAAERAELVVRQRRHGAGDAGQVARVVRRRDRDDGEGQALGVDELEGAGVDRRGGHVGGHAERDQAARRPRSRSRPERAVREQLEVVELARRRAVLRGGAGSGTGAMVPHARGRSSRNPE